MKTIRITPSTQVLGVVALISAGMLLLAVEAPEIQRYLKVRGM